jgi:hypothetical protein
MIFRYIPKQPQESGVCQGGSPDFLPGASGSAREHDASEDEKCGGKPLLLLWPCRWCNYDSSFYIQKSENSYFWCRILEKREKNL